MSLRVVLYAPYPDNWPTFTPRDKLASWLEQYTDSQDLIVWTSSELVPTPIYDNSMGRWTVVIKKAGTMVTLHPAHIVLATGTHGTPFMPTIPGADIFTGELLHASAYAGGEPYAGKRVVVVGAGNTAADMCQDLEFRGAASVTMLQRSVTCVVSDAFIKNEFSMTWPEGVPVDISDFKIASMPLGLLRHISIDNIGHEESFHRDMHDGLRKAGLKLSFGPDRAGQKILVFERLGGQCVK